MQATVTLRPEKQPEDLPMPEKQPEDLPMPDNTMEPDIPTISSPNIDVPNGDTTKLLTIKPLTTIANNPNPRTNIPIPSSTAHTTSSHTTGRPIDIVRRKVREQWQKTRDLEAEVVKLRKEVRELRNEDARLNMENAAMKRTVEYMEALFREKGIIE
jgi:hypothetical protein